MATNIVNTNNGTDFSSLIGKGTIIYCNPLGEALNPDGTSTGIKIRNTNNGTDFSSLKAVINVNTLGNA